MSAKRPRLWNPALDFISILDWTIVVFRAKAVVVSTHFRVFIKTTSILSPKSRNAWPGQSYRLVGGVCPLLTPVKLRQGLQGLPHKENGLLACVGQTRVMKFCSLSHSPSNDYATPPSGNSLTASCRSSTDHYLDPGMLQWRGDASNIPGKLFTRTLFVWSQAVWGCLWNLGSKCKVRLMARPHWLSRESSRECLVFLLAICPNSSRLTVYTGLRMNLQFLANSDIKNVNFLLFMSAP